uniref:SFRICE_007242 n=1 Tax=Spodoptera frugiperda TaxID=7108 RepID=A0A2H1V008_SPOFR
MDDQVDVSAAEPQVVAGPSGRTRKRNVSSSSSSTTSSSSSSSSSPKRTKRSRRSRRKKNKRARQSNSTLGKLIKEVQELREQVFVNNTHNACHDGLSVCSGVSGELYDQHFEEQTECPNVDDKNSQLDFTFDIETKLKEPSVPKTPENLLKMLLDVQRLGSSAWSEVRYSDTQKLYNHSPGFIDLDTNEEIKMYDTLRHLAHADKSYAAITFCILKQKESLQEAIRNLLLWAKNTQVNYDNLSGKVEELFQKDLLQLVCGHRAESIEMRRDAITTQIRDPLVKASLNRIPPTSTHLFSPDLFATALEKAGGVRKAFWPPKSESHTRSNQEAHFTTVARGPIEEVTEVEDVQAIQKVLEGTKNVTNNDSIRFRAGQLAHYRSKWTEMGAPEIVLKLIQGYRIPFIKKPPLIYPNLINGPFQTPVSKEMSAIIDKMKSQGILKVVQLSPSFVSPLFLTPKPDGSSRPIFNLKMLNKFVKAQPFHLINMYRIPDFLQPQDRMCKIDLSQAYFHLKISKSHRRFLRLIYNQELLEMTCLPFGLSTAPKTFSILTNWIAQILRERWDIRIIVYLDDYLIVNQNAHVLRDHVQITLDTLQDLGWQVNFEKSVLYPQKTITYLGILWNPWDNLKSLPKEKTFSLIKKVSSVLDQGMISVKELQKITGLLNFASYVVPRGRLNHRQLLMFMNSLPDHASKSYPLTQNVQNELEWWIRNCQASTPLHYPPPVHFLTTDASNHGWGAQLNNLAVSGNWSQEEQTLHSNQKEMLAILRALEDNAHLLRNSSILIQCDNRTAVSYLRNEGGTKSLPLIELTYRILNLLDQCQIHFSIHHLPGKMAPNASLYANDICKVGNPNNRFVCLGDSSRSLQLCIPRPERPTSPVSRCIQCPLELFTCVDISTPILNSKSPNTPKSIDRDILNSSTTMGQGILARRPQSPSTSSAANSTQVTDAPDRHIDGASTPTSTENRPRSLEMWGWSEAVETWTPEQRLLLKNSWRKSTLKTYEVAWKRWTSWSMSKNIDMHNPTVRGAPKPASRTVIAGWVKTLFKEAGIIATPGSTRSAVASKSWLENHPLDEILSRGNWQSAKTFQNFYRREVIRSGDSNLNVSELFNPVN